MCGIDLASEGKREGEHGGVADKGILHANAVGVMNCDESGDERVAESGRGCDNKTPEQMKAKVSTRHLSREQLILRG